MKKLFTLIILSALGVLSVNAQGTEQFISASINAEIKFSEGVYDFKYTKGYRFNDDFFLGGGIGLDIYTYSDDTIRIKYDNLRGYSEVQSSTTVALPIFVAGRYYFSAKNGIAKVIPYLHLEAGYIIGNSDSNGIITSGVYISPNVGVEFNENFFIQIGLSQEQNDNLLTWDLADGNRSKVRLCVGWKF